MQVQRFDNAQSFYDHVEPFLVQNEAENNLIIGLTSTVIQNPNAYGDAPPFMATVEHDGTIIQTILRTPPYNVVLSTTDDMRSIEVIVQYLKEVYGTIPGVLGSSEISKTFAEYWHETTGTPYKIIMNQRIFQLERVIHVEGVVGSMRQATESDRKLLTEWFIRFNADALGDTKSREDVQPNINRFLGGVDSGRYLGIWQVDGRPVSMAGATGPTPNGIRIGAVYTPPEHRKNGYASACVAALSQLQLDRGRKFCFLFTDLSNPTSNKIYQDIGYRPICDSDQYQFEN